MTLVALGNCVPAMAVLRTSVVESAARRCSSVLAAVFRPLLPSAATVPSALRDACWRRMWATHADDSACTRCGLPALMPHLACMSSLFVHVLQVVDFCSAYAQLREMGFSPAAVAGSLAISDNSSERALSLLVV